MSQRYPAIQTAIYNQLKRLSDYKNVRASEKASRERRAKSNDPEIRISEFFSSLRCNARYRKLSFKINQSDIMVQLLAQGGLCAKTKLELTYQQKSENLMSVDRIDSTRGYTRDNIQIVIVDVNFMKNDMTEDRLNYLCKRIAANC